MIMKKTDTTIKIIENIEIAPQFYRMTLELTDAKNKFKVGQFFNLKILPKSNEILLRRPFAPSEILENSLSFVYAVVGKGTAKMTRLLAGDKVEVLYPLGNGFSIPEDKSIKCILVGGGCGAPSMLALASHLKEKGFTVHLAVGAKNECYLLEIDKMKTASSSIVIATDDGSSGVKGHAVAAAEKIINNLDLSDKVNLFGCGPEPMLKGLATLATKYQLPCEVSLEARMACGFGACVGCVVKIKKDNNDNFVYKKVCKDGPVFTANGIIWE